MTDRAAARRGVMALALIPLSAGAFGGTVAWAGSHDPLAEAAAATAQAEAVVTPVVATVPAGPTPTEVLLGSLSVQVADAQARVAALQATLDQRTADAAAAAATQAAAAQAAASAPRASAPRASAPRAAAPAAAPAPAPATNTTTQASG